MTAEIAPFGQELTDMLPTRQLTTTPTPEVPATRGDFAFGEPLIMPRLLSGPIHSGTDTFFHLHKRATQQRRPKHIFTADGPNPKEIDDGVFVEALPSATEMYRVGR